MQQIKKGESRNKAEWTLTGLRLSRKEARTTKSYVAVVLVTF